MTNRALHFLFIIWFTALAAFPSAAQDMPTGMLFDDEAYKNTEQKAVLTRSLYNKIPKAYSLKQYAPEVKNQGQYGTCVGWSSAYAGFTIAESVNAGRTDTKAITAEAYSPGYVYKQIKFSSDANCTTGSYIHQALEVMKTKGAAKYSALSEVNCPGYISPDIFNQAANHKIESYAKLFSLYDNESFKISSTKKSLSQNKPVIIGMNVPKSFFTAKEVWNPMESDSGKYYGHAMCVVGYNDNLHGGVFEIMNSWGPQWGNNGFMYIKYSDYAKFVKYAYELNAKPYTQDKQFRLAGSIRLENAEGKTLELTKTDKNYKTKESIPTGSMFRIYIQNSGSAYVYAFGFDKTKKVFPIFPHDEKISPYLSYSANEVAIPDESHFIQTDETEGTNYICVLLSAKEIDINRLHKDIENTNGTFRERVNQAVGSDLMSDTEVSYSKSNAALRAESKKHTAAFLILEADHLKQ